MALFNRGNKNKTDVPAEIQEYYETGKRDRTGIAWLLAFGTLILTIVLAAGIFFAGRFAYRKIAGNNDTSQVAQNDTQPQEEQSPETPAPSEEQQRTEEERQAEEQRKADEARRAEEQKAEEERKAAAERKAAEERERAAQQRAEEEATPAPTQQSAGGSSEDRQVAAGDAIPETGPGDTLAIFIAVTILGYMAHRLHFAKRS